MTEEPSKTPQVVAPEGIIVASTGVSKASISYVDVPAPEISHSKVDEEAAKKAAFCVGVV